MDDSNKKTVPEKMIDDYLTHLLQDPTYMLLNRLVEKDWGELNLDAERKILEVLIKEGNRSIYEVCDSATMTDFADTTIRNNMKRMEKAGYIEIAEKRLSKKKNPTFIYKLTRKGVWRALAVLGEDIDLEFLISKYSEIYPSVRDFRKIRSLSEVVFWFRAYFLAGEPENVFFLPNLADPFGVDFRPFSYITKEEMEKKISDPMVRNKIRELISLLRIHRLTQ